VANGSGAFSFALTGNVNANASNSLVANATDSTGAVSVCSTVRAYVHDSLPPAIPVITPTVAAHDAFTNQLTVSGTAEANSTVRLYNLACPTVSTGTPLATTLASGTGAFSASFTPVSNAAIQVFATAADAAGNVSGCSTTSATSNVYISVSGQVSGATATGSTVRVKVNGAGNFSSTVDGSGNYVVTGPMGVGPGAVVTVFLDNSTLKATTYTRQVSATSNLTSVSLTVDAVTLMHHDSGPLTNANLNQYDADQDTDIGLVTDGTNATVSAGHMLMLAANTSYAPGGTLTTTASTAPLTRAGDVEIRFGATLSMGASTLSVGGDFQNLGTYSRADNQTTLFTAQAAGHLVEIGSSSFFHLTFDGLNGSWGYSASLVVVGDMLFAQGAEIQQSD
jgi:hypothetical protein